MERQLLNPGTELIYAAGAIVNLAIGAVFVVILPHPSIFLVVLPLFAGIAVVCVTEGYYRTPNKIRVGKEGLEFNFRSRDPRKIPWQDVLKVEIPASDPTTFFGRNLTQAKLYIKGEERPFFLRVPPAMNILEAKREAESSSEHTNQPGEESDSAPRG